MVEVVWRPWRRQNAKEARWKSSTWIGFRETWLEHASTIRRVLVDLPSRRPCSKDAMMGTWLTSDFRAERLILVVPAIPWKPQVPRLEDSVTLTVVSRGGRLPPRHVQEH